MKNATLKKDQCVTLSYSDQNTKCFAQVICILIITIFLSCNYYYLHFVHEENILYMQTLDRWMIDSHIIGR